MVVLKIEKWLGRSLCEILGMPAPPPDARYQIDMSSKNPRFKRKIYSNDQLAELRLEPMGYFVAWAAAGCHPATMGMGPVPAVHELLEFS